MSKSANSVDLITINGVQFVGFYANRGFVKYSDNFKYKGELYMASMTADGTIEIYRNLGGHAWSYRGSSHEMAVE